MVLAKRTTINQESQTYYYHKDHLGSTRSVTDSGKNIIAASTYHPFGETEVKEGSEYYLYTGKEKDASDLYYYGTRYYDPQSGRFITRDTWTYLPNDIRSNGSCNIYWLINSQKFNRYAYCNNNPVKYIDPSGNGWKSILVSIGVLAITIGLIIFVPPVGIAVYLAEATIITETFIIINSVYETTKVDIDIRINASGDIVAVFQSNQDNDVGGWYLDDKNGGYMVWSEEEQEWVFVPYEEWEPPPPYGPGDIVDKMITIENYPRNYHKKNSESNSLPPGASNPDIYIV